MFEFLKRKPDKFLKDMDVSFGNTKKFVFKNGMKFNDEGDITLWWGKGYYNHIMYRSRTLNKKDIIYNENEIKFIEKDVLEYNMSYEECLERKENYKEYIADIEYIFDMTRWEWGSRHPFSPQKRVLSNNLHKELEPMGIFINEFDSKYKLIESVIEFKEYMDSSLSCDDWCRLKLIKKMKEIGLGDGFINAFSDLIGNDLTKYHQMIDLEDECDDKDILMYMFTYKFGEK